MKVKILKFPFNAGYDASIYIDELDWDISVRGETKDEAVKTLLTTLDDLRKELDKAYAVVLAKHLKVDD